jgi:DNA-binding MarR family transcriptional regulator
MSPTKPDPERHPLADIDQMIHAPARLMMLSCLYVVESADYVFLMRQTGLTWGNLSTHLTKLEEAGYVEIEKEFKGKKPHTTVSLTKRGRAAFRDYKKSLRKVLDDLPD